MCVCVCILCVCECEITLFVVADYPQMIYIYIYIYIKKCNAIIPNVYSILLKTGSCVSGSHRCVCGSWAGSSWITSAGRVCSPALTVTRS